MALIVFNIYRVLHHRLERIKVHPQFRAQCGVEELDGDAVVDVVEAFDVVLSVDAKAVVVDSVVPEVVVPLEVVVSVVVLVNFVVVNGVVVVS